jgi:hypothetical protein
MAESLLDHVNGRGQLTHEHAREVTREIARRATAVAAHLEAESATIATR